MLIVKIVFAILSALFLLSLLRVGVRARYQENFFLELRIGPVKRTLYPKTEKKAVESAAPSQATEGTAAKKKKRFTIPKLTREEWREGIDTALLALKRTVQKVCRRIRIDPLELCVIFGGSDPADTAINYGRANAALWTFMPRLEELFHIPNPAIRLGMDYTEKKTLVAQGEIGITLRIYELIVIALTLAIPLLKWYRRIKKAHRNDPISTSAAEDSRMTKETKNNTLPV